jgi:4-amino-4-deoxy-L-arabinose transferase-like glycosyltransferase
MIKKINNSFWVFLLFFIANFIIFFRFNQIPKNINYDEVDFAKLALSLNNQPYTPYTPFATGHATFYFYIILFSFKLLGVNNLALRLPSALFGVLNVILIFFIYKLVFNNKKYLPFFLSLIFLTSHWYLNFARFSFEATFFLLLELSSIYFLFHYFKTSKNFDLILSGIFAGLVFNSYPPGRIFFLLPLFFLLYKPLKTDHSKKYFLFIIPFIITILPLTVYLLSHKDIRFSQQFYLQNKNLSVIKKTEYLLNNIKTTALMFHFKGDMNGRHNYPGKPALNPVLGLFFILGLVSFFIKKKSIYSRFFLFYFFISLLPTLFTNPAENPNMLRTFTSLPAIVYFSGLGFEKVSTKLKSPAIDFIVFLLVLFSCFYELRTYFSFQKRVFKNSFEIKCSVEKLIDKNKPFPKECLVSRNEF